MPIQVVRGSRQNTTPAITALRVPVSCRASTTVRAAANPTASALGIRSVRGLYPNKSKTRWMPA